MKTHTTIGATILSGKESPFLKMGHDIALFHHENWDGSGYPHGWAGEKISLPARITHICDVYDGLRCKRPHKPAFDHKTAMRILTKGDSRTSSDHFDPRVLEVFVSVQDGIRDIFASFREQPDGPSLCNEPVAPRTGYSLLRPRYNPEIYARGR